MGAGGWRCGGARRMRLTALRPGCRGPLGGGKGGGGGGGAPLARRGGGVKGRRAPQPAFSFPRAERGGDGGEGEGVAP